MEDIEYCWFMSSLSRLNFWQLYRVIHRHTLAHTYPISRYKENNLKKGLRGPLFFPPIKPASHQLLLNTVRTPVISSFWPVKMTVFSRVTWSMWVTGVVFPCFHVPKMLKKTTEDRKAEIKNSMEPCKGSYSLSILVSAIPVSIIVFSPAGGRLWFVIDISCVHWDVMFSFPGLLLWVPTLKSCFPLAAQRFFSFL